MLLVWPTIFGSGSGEPARAAVPAAPVTVELASVDADGGASRVRLNVPPSARANPQCIRRFAAKVDACHGRRRCIATAKTRRDLCAATGSWPD